MRLINDNILDENREKILKMLSDILERMKGDWKTHYVIYPFMMH